jgi:hypothetical protein
MKENFFFFCIELLTINERDSPICVISSLTNEETAKKNGIYILDEQVNRKFLNVMKLAEFLLNKKSNTISLHLELC